MRGRPLAGMSLVRSGSVRSRFVRLGVLAGTLALVAACSGGGGGGKPTSTSATGPTSAISTTAPTTATTASKATANKTTVKKSTPAPTTRPSVESTRIDTPKVYSLAQPAVDAYVDYLRAALVVGEDPAEIRRGPVNMFLGGQAKLAVNASFDAMAKAGTAYRGAPDKPHIAVQGLPSNNVVLLTNCPSPSSTDPYRMFALKTGKTVPMPRGIQPPPYQVYLTMFHNKAGHWVLTKFYQDVNRTCAA